MATDEQKFIFGALRGAIETCGEMLGDMDANIGTPALSATVTVTCGPLSGRRVRITFEIVDEDIICIREKDHRDDD
jgi:hypothetical protein